MPDLSTELYDRVVRLLQPFMETEDDRQAELRPVVLGKQIDIRWEGTPKQFTVRLDPPRVASAEWWEITRPNLVGPLDIDPPHFVRRSCSSTRSTT
jgi:hypothetical protein